MLEFIISNYLIFIVAAIVLLLGLFGYMMDRKKYKQYREEIVNEERASETMAYQPDIQNVATPVLLDDENPQDVVVAPPVNEVQPNQVIPQVNNLSTNGNEVPESGQN